MNFPCLQVLPTFNHKQHTFFPGNRRKAFLKEKWLPKNCYSLSIYFFFPQAYNLHISGQRLRSTTRCEVLLLPGQPVFIMGTYLPPFPLCKTYLKSSYYSQKSFFFLMYPFALKSPSDWIGRRNFNFYFTMISQDNSLKTIPPSCI